jgi:bifunctional non-homologous end joining protein LigD
MGETGRNAAEPPSVMVTHASRRHTNRSRYDRSPRLARSAPRWRLSAPPGFIRPCEPALVTRPPAGPGWLHEIKHDGFRILA